MIYPYAITFKDIPIDISRNHRFDVKNLRETEINSFDIGIHSRKPLVDASGAYLDKALQSCAIAIQVQNPRGRTICEDSIRLADLKWSEQNIGDKGHSLWRSLNVAYPKQVTGDFTILVHVVAPSRNMGDYISIRGKGLFDFDTQTKTANKPPLPTGNNPATSPSITVP